jgi:NADH dehydrogenase [ubiquinone] 1 alpha subcomplex assembly factor 6
MRRSAPSGLSDCAAAVREHDPDRYLATLFAPSEARQALFALYAFDHQIARVRHLVREPMAGLVRFQWWRDALEGIAAGRPLAHPVIAALHADWATFAPLRPRLERAIDAREVEFRADPPADMAELEERLEGSHGEITLAAVALLGADTKPVCAAARHLGRALGLVRLIQALPVDLSRDPMRLPLSVINRSEIDRESSEQPRAGRALAPLVADLAARAQSHLQQSRRYRREVPRAALPALLHATLLERYLGRLARAGHDPFARVATRPGGGAPLRLLAQHLLGRY